MISETDKNKDFITSIFKIKLLSLIGLKPQVEECVKCRKKENLNSFSIKDNGVKCKDCLKIEKNAITISQSTLLALKFIITAPIKKVFNFNLKDESLNELKLLSNIYFNEKLEKEYKLENLF